MRSEILNLSNCYHWFIILHAYRCHLYKIISAESNNKKLKRNNRCFLNVSMFVPSTAHINYNIDNNNVVNDGMVYVTVGPRHQMQPNPDHIPLAQPPRENSPYNNSSSEKESTSSSTTFRTNHGNSICFIFVLLLLYPFSHWRIYLHCYYFEPNDGWRKIRLRIDKKTGTA